ncbi:MAG: alpha/beta hydrolase, partial [Candidatus Competibacteraceae bacterium]|nr:alpha/beta hydrolase [Candidatus Competibacteraceae bacterium]
GGRPDLTPDLTRVRCPVLLIVGGLDKPVIGMNQAAARQLSHCEHRLEIVPGATHLFEQPGTLEAASGLARDWFLDRLGTGSS